MHERALLQEDDDHIALTVRCLHIEYHCLTLVLVGKHGGDSSVRRLDIDFGCARYYSLQVDACFDLRICSLEKYVGPGFVLPNADNVVTLETLIGADNGP